MPNPSEANYGNSRFRAFPNFGESGIRTVHATPETSSRPPSPQKRSPSMKPLSKMNYQETHRAPQRGRSTAPPSGLAGGDYQDVVDLMGANEEEPMTGVERHELELIAEDMWGENNSNVF